MRRAQGAGLNRARVQALNDEVVEASLTGAPTAPAHTHPLEKDRQELPAVAQGGVQTVSGPSQGRAAGAT